MIKNLAHFFEKKVVESAIDPLLQIFESIFVIFFQPKKEEKTNETEKIHLFPIKFSD